MEMTMGLSKLAAENVRDIIRRRHVVPATIAKECNQSASIPGAISKSYISAFVRDEKLDSINLTTDKLETIAAYFKIAPWQILHPAGIDSNGQSKATDGLNDEAMSRAVKYCLDLANKLEVNDNDFVAAAITMTYECFVSNGDESQLSLNLIELAKSSSS